MSKLPLISIIVVNYNTSTHITDLLDALLLSSYPNFEVIIVDNASPNDDLAHLLEHQLSVTLIESTENLGFAGGNNLGMEAGNGDYFLFLNPDVVIMPNLIEELLIPFKINPQVGMVSPKIKYYDNPEIIQYAGFSAMSRFTMRTKAYGKGSKDNSLNNYATPTSFGHGAAMLLSREVVQQVGKMNPNYFLYYEEFDWAERIRKAGFMIYYAPETIVLHKESMAVQQDSPLKTYYLARNRLLFARLHYTAWQKLGFFFYQLLILFPRNVLKYINQPPLLRAYIKGVTWHLSL